jgi:(p)ppGpp synthase/HD superfamily hydrolase
MVRDKQTAAELAERLHADQFDELGAPYIDHLRRVVDILLANFRVSLSPRSKAAWLHGTLEDTGETPSSLASDRVSKDTLRMVQMLTRPEDFGYLDWIRVIAASSDQSVIRVNLADIEDHQDPRCAAARAARAHIVAER